MGATRQRLAYPADEKGQPHVTAKALIGTSAIDDSGKEKPKQGLPGGSGLELEGDESTPPGIEGKAAAVKLEPYDDTPTLVTAKAANHRLYVPILKVLDERHTITGVVLEPDTIDAHGDIIPALVILDAAEDFLADYNRATTMGLEHKDLNPPIDLVQSWIVPDLDIVINSVIVKAGSWVITARVNSKAIWDKIKQGKLTGFSIGGMAQVVNLQPQAA